MKSTSSKTTSSAYNSSESLTSNQTTGSSVDVKTRPTSSISAIPKPSGPLRQPSSLSAASATLPSSLSETVDDFSLNETVWVNGSKQGTIKFIGDTKFAPGKWIGIQLALPVGKNDGSVGDVKYFSCPANFGVFVKPQRLTKTPVPESVFQKLVPSLPEMVSFIDFVLLF